MPTLRRPRRSAAQAVWSTGAGSGTIGVETFDATYGAGFQASDDSPHAVECELVEDGGAFVVRTGRPMRTVPTASPSSTAPYAPRCG